MWRSGGFVIGSVWTSCGYCKRNSLPSRQGDYDGYGNPYSLLDSTPFFRIHLSEYIGIGDAEPPLP